MKTTQTQLIKTDEINFFRKPRRRVVVCSVTSGGLRPLFGSTFFNTKDTRFNNRNTF